MQGISWASRRGRVGCRARRSRRSSAARRSGLARSLRVWPVGGPRSYPDTRPVWKPTSELPSTRLLGQRRVDGVEPPRQAPKFGFRAAATSPGLNVVVLPSLVLIYHEPSSVTTNWGDGQKCHGFSPTCCVTTKPVSAKSSEFEKTRTYCNAASPPVEVKSFVSSLPHSASSMCVIPSALTQSCR